MFQRLKAISKGLHFRFLSLVIGVASLLLCVQLGLDSYVELTKARSQRLNVALDVTNVVARTLEKQFDNIELDDIEQILVSIRKRGDIAKLSVVDKNVTFHLDGDLATSPTAPAVYSKVQMDALQHAKTAYEVTDNTLEVGEPLFVDGRAIGAVMVAFRLPDVMQTILPIVKSKISTVIPIVLVGLLLAAQMVSQVTAPLRKLSLTVKAISDDNLEGEVEPEGALEI